MNEIDITLPSMPWMRKWQSAPVFLPGKSHGQRSLVGSSPLGLIELDMTEQLSIFALPSMSYISDRDRHTLNK